MVKNDVLRTVFPTYLCSVKRCKIQIMKKTIKKIGKSLLAVTLFASVIGNASETNSLNVKIDIEKTVTIENVKKGNLLSIRNYKGVIIYKELIQSSGTYTNEYDLTKLPNGRYFFEVDKDLEIKTIPFTVNNSSVTFKKGEELTIYKPYVREKKNLVYITQLALDLEPLKISIYENLNDDFYLIHSEKVEGSQTLGKVYQLNKGSYKIVLNSNNKEFTKFINK